MAKLTLNDIVNITGHESQAINILNTNSDAIETALENTLSRDGTSPNSMNADIDMNENDLLNVGTIDTGSLSINGVSIAGIDDIANVGPAGPVPELAVVSDGTRRVLKVQGFVDDGDEHIGEYIGSSGYVADIASGVDIRGQSGSGSGDVIAANNGSDFDDVAVTFDTLKQTATDDYEGVSELATFAEAIAGSNTNVIGADVMKQIIDMVTPVGTVGSFLRATTAPTYWLILNGNTIGSEFSGGSSRANADTYTLYDILWSNYSNTDLTIQTSLGVATTRGVSSLADFNANKRMPLPDFRGVFLRGLDLSKGIDSGRVLGTVQQDAYQSHTHTGTTSTTGSHSHSGTTSTNTHDHAFDMPQGDARFAQEAYDPLNNTYWGPPTGGTRQGGFDTSNDSHNHTFTTSSGGSHSHTFTTASSGGAETRPVNHAVMYCVRY